MFCPLLTADGGNHCACTLEEPGDLVPESSERANHISALPCRSVLQLWELKIGGQGSLLLELHTTVIVILQATVHMVSTGSLNGLSPSVFSFFPSLSRIPCKKHLLRQMYLGRSFLSMYSFLQCTGEPSKYVACERWTSLNDGLTPRTSAKSCTFPALVWGKSTSYSFGKRSE